MTAGRPALISLMDHYALPWYRVTLLEIQKLAYFLQAAGEPLKLEIASFLDSVRSRREPRVTARQGREALALALEIQRAMVEHAGKAGIGDFFLAG